MLAAALVFGVLLGADTAPAQIPGATYTGDHSGHRSKSAPAQRVVLKVSSDGRHIQTLSFAGTIWMPKSGYAGGTISWEDGSAGAITNDRFTVVSDFVVCQRSALGADDWANRYYVHGTFDDTQRRVTGTIRAETVDSCTLEVIKSLTYDLTWSARTNSSVREATAPNKVGKVVGATVSAKKVQRQRTKVRVTVKAKAGERVAAKATGWVRLGNKNLKLGRQTRSISAGMLTTFVLKLKKRADDTKVMQALGHHKKVTATVKVELANHSGTRSAKSVKVMLTGAA